MSTAKKSLGGGMCQAMTGLTSSEPQRNPEFNRSKTRGVHLIPDTVACEGTTTVALIFDEIPDLRGTGKVEVSFRSVGKTDTIVATPINQQSFRVVAPENRAGAVPVVIFVGGVEAASTHLNYTQEGVHLVTGVAQVHLQLLVKLGRHLRVLQSKQRTQNPMSELDQCLSEWFEDKEDVNRIQPKVFEELFDILRHSPSAEFGLTKLAERLMDLPGSERASQVRNAEGLTASMMALNNKYDTLCTILDKKREVNRETDNAVAKPSQTDDSTDEQYVKPDNFDDNYDIVISPKTSPPVLITKRTQPLKLGPRTSLDQLPTSPPPPPPPHRRESRDSGFDASDFVPSPSADQRRQAFTRVRSEEPSSTRDKWNRRALEPSSSQDSSLRPKKLSEEEDIRLQLSRPVLPNNGPKRSSPFAK